MSNMPDVFQIGVYSSIIHCLQNLDADILFISRRGIKILMFILLHLSSQ